MDRKLHFSQAVECLHDELRFALRVSRGGEMPKAF